MKKQKDGSGSSHEPKKITSDAIISFLETRHGRASKAEIARQFGITGNDRIGLKHVLKELLARGQLHHGTFRSYVLPHVAKQEAKPVRKNMPGKPTDKKGVKAFAKQDDRDERGPIYYIGLYEPLQSGGGMVVPVSRQDKHPIMIGEGRQKSARRGDLVKALYNPKGWEILEILAEDGDAGMVSLMTIKSLDIPNVFSKEVLAETENISVPPLGKRTDLRDVPLVTIDGEDARDFDDAVYAEADDADDNKGGWKITVAIADVSYYVRPNSALDNEAYKRGNSVYFPDRVVPMLPEALSNDLCSLRPNETRACMAALMRVNKFGTLIDAMIVRGLMKSKARLTYTEVQEALDGQPNEKTKPILDTVLIPLFEAYKTLAKARTERGTVELDLPERKVILKDGQVQEIVTRARFDSHKLIEEMMILANVAVAKAFEKKEQAALYRVHPKPDTARWSNTREFLLELGLKTKSGLHPAPGDLQALLEAVEGRDEAPLVNDMVLRTMSQASYSPENLGHFGLALDHYAHFTSPIRRYADLIVHRALIRAFNLGDDGLTDYELGRLEIIGTHISDRERVAQSAERETIDRYIALYLQDEIGATFHARVSGVTKFGLFVNVEPFGADGLIPVRTLPDDFYIHDEKRHSLTGRRNGLTFRLAMPLTVRLVEVESATGRLLMELLPGSITLPAGGGSKDRARRDFGRRQRDEETHSRGPGRNKYGRGEKKRGPRR